ncbi:MAG TPA: PBP1A family penicillin-binding protein [Gemmatimonadaceae bacterium]
MPPGKKSERTPRRQGRFKRFRRNHPVAMRVMGLTLTLLVAFGAGLLFSAWTLVCRGGQCPTIEVLDEYTPNQTSKLYAADGRFIAELGIERRTLIRLDEIPQVVRDAFVVTEDKRFYSHAGIDWYRVFGAALNNLRAGAWQEGFSTITMQLARNIFTDRISREKTLVRKIKEGKVARAIEARYDKSKILELYLNQIDLGSGAYGVETAAQRYFGKSVRDLNVAEAATLAALPKAPARYNPRRFPERAVQRRNTVIELMRQEGKITDATASLAKAYPLRLASRTESGDIAPYFVEWVRQQLDEKFGRQLYEQGLRVYTTLDLDMQSAAERALEAQLRAIEAGRFGAYSHVSYERYLARRVAGEEDIAAASPYLQGAFIAIDPQSGAIRAMVGGRDFYDSKFNRAVQALRQPGSTFKPIVYATGIRSGRPPAYILDDVPISLPNMGGETWEPRNYDGRFEGPIPMRRSLYMSRNLSTIDLGMELGEERVIGTSRAFGLTTPIPAVPSIHIGAADVYPIEMVSAFTAFANMGVRATPQPIIRVENQRGEILWQPTPLHTQVLSQTEAWLMVDMLKDVVRRGTAAGSVWGAGFQIPAGGKTGTTNDGTNVWFIGFTADLVAGVWMGFDRPQRIKGNAQGGTLAAPAWTAFMREVYRRKPAPPDWPRPEGIVIREIDPRTGLLQSAYCPGPAATEFFISGTEPTQECSAAYYGISPSGMSIMPPMGGTNDPSGESPVPSQEIRVSPGAVPLPQPARDTRRSDSIARVLGDSLRRRAVADSIRRAQSGVPRVARPSADTSRLRPPADTSRLRAPRQP